MVAAKDSEGTEDATPAKWTFNTAHYPAAPSTSKMSSPSDGQTDSHYFTLEAEWGSAPEGGGVSGVTFQVKREYGKEYETIPSKYVTTRTGEPITWPLPVSANPGHTEPVYFDAQAYRYLDAGSYYPLTTQASFRAMLDGGKNAAGVTDGVAVEFEPEHGTVHDAAEQIGPATVNLVTGHYTIARTDVSIPVPGSEASLEFTRVYESEYHGYGSQSRVLGGAWEPSAPVESASPEEAWVGLSERHEDAVPPFEEEGEVIEPGEPAHDWVEVATNEGYAIEFEKSGSTYVSPDYAKELVLTKIDETTSR